jgi:succinate-semialdehyde dehydrogenase / glutarate-semialdehyde dehydrogenase
MAISNFLRAKLADPSLVREAAYVGGEWISSLATGKRYAVTNPSDNSELASLPDVGAGEARQTPPTRPKNRGPRRPQNSAA